MTTQSGGRHRGRQPARMEIPLHGRPDRLCVGALGDSDPLLRHLGHAELGRPTSMASSPASRSRRRCSARALPAPLSLPAWQMPALHNLVQRMPPVAPLNAKPEGGRVCHQLALGRRHRRLCCRPPYRSVPEVERRPVEERDHKHSAPHENSRPGDRPGAGPRLFDPLLAAPTRSWDWLSPAPARSILSSPLTWAGWASSSPAPTPLPTRCSAACSGSRRSSFTSMKS